MSSLIKPLLRWNKFWWMLGGWFLNRWSGLCDLCWGDVCLLRVFQGSWLQEPQTSLLSLTWDGWVFVLCSSLSSLSSCSSCFYSWMVTIELSLNWWVQSELSMFSVRGPASRFFLNAPVILPVFVLGNKTQIVKKKNLSAHLQLCVCVWVREGIPDTMVPPHLIFCCSFSLHSLTAFLFLSPLAWFAITLFSVLYEAYFPSSVGVLTSLCLCLQDSASSMGSGEFTGIKELDELSQEIAQLQR